MTEKKTSKKERLDVDVVTSVGEKDVTVEIKVNGKSIEINVTNNLEVMCKTQI